MGVTHLYGKKTATGFFLVFRLCSPQAAVVCHFGHSTGSTSALRQVFHKASQGGNNQLGSSVPVKASSELHNRPADTGCAERGLVQVPNAPGGSRLGTEMTRLAL